MSARQAFRDMPVHPTILKYIQKIGVGRVATPKRRRAKSRKRAVVSSLQILQQSKTLRQPLPPIPFSTVGGDISLKSESDVKRLPVKILGTVGSKRDVFPRATKGLPEIAIAGRSNVGKSTLLNALLYGKPPPPKDGGVKRSRRQGRGVKFSQLSKGVKAATSDTPGETRQLTFYQLSAQIASKQDTEDKQHKRKVSLLLVDLPGYGFAYATDDKKQEWQTLMEDYILDRGPSLKRVLLLVDARHGMKQSDVAFLQHLQRSMQQRQQQSSSSSTKPAKKQLPPLQVVLTKCDLVSQADLARRVVTTRQELSHALIREPKALPILLVSARLEGQPGVLELQKELAALVPKNKG